MFYTYYSHQLSAQKEKLIEILTQYPNPNPFESETVLVQSIGMAQWLQMQIAQSHGVAGNFQFPYPTSFLWQQYRVLFPELPKENIFARNSMVWRLMRLIPQQLALPEFSQLKHYLKNPDQLKLFQLAAKIADLFDQYLVYRPHWLIHWENNELESVLASFQVRHDEVVQSNLWQSLLWKALVADIKQDSDAAIFNTSHRAYLRQRYFEKLDHLTAAEQQKLPSRIFVFGISAMPILQLEMLQKLSEYCDVHLFFTNPTEAYWGDDLDSKVFEKLALKALAKEQHAEDVAKIEAELEALLASQGHQLLLDWGKQGRDFLSILADYHLSGDDFLAAEIPHPDSLLGQIKQSMLEFEPHPKLHWQPTDRSIQIHSCHSKMREVEVLHNQLLQLFERDPTLTPKDIIVMSADIDSYAPYINAVFARYEQKSESGERDPRYIPFTLSDQKVSYVDPIVSSFLNLLSFKERKYSAEEVLALFDVNAIRAQYYLSPEQLLTLREWVKKAGVRSGLEIAQAGWNNYNAWENGLNRLLLGLSLKEDNGSWQGTLAFDESYGLSAELAGYLAKFVDDLTACIRFLQQPQHGEAWRVQLHAMINQFYQEELENLDTLAGLHQAVDSICDTIAECHFEEGIEIEVIRQLVEQQLSEQRSNLNFLIGRVNFCTLLPMRAIPFKVICLLGMNEGEFPRQQTRNSFDLMQYAQQKGDRARRDDDRYLFLEALLSAQQQLYISYIGQSLSSSDEKLPSVLVSQLMDYINQHLAKDCPQAFQPIKQPMTVFSPRNFALSAQEASSYDVEWLNIKAQRADLRAFLDPIVRKQSDLPSEIDLDDLIAYVQNPVKYFCQQHLSLYFEEQDSSIAESEYFDIPALEKSAFFEALLNLQAESSVLFEQEKLKGNLPVNHFGRLVTESMEREIHALKAELSDYLHQASGVYEVDLALENGLQLIGNIPNRFGAEIVQWRAGKLRDQDIIKSWIYWLCLCAKGDISQLSFYYREGQQAGRLTFCPIEAEQAGRLLQIFAQDYLCSFSQLKWALNQQISLYFKGIKVDEEATSVAEKCQKAIESSAAYNPYLIRVLQQMPEMDWNAVHETTVSWFKLMYDSQQLTEINME